jgi:hypothetical protein
MVRPLLCAAIAVLLGACADGEAPALFYSAAERDAERCEAAGYEKDSDAYRVCVERAAYYRAAQREYRSLASPSVRCTAGSNAGGCF